MDPEAVYHYVKTCVNFVEFAQEVSTPELREWLLRIIEMKVEDFPAVTVLHAMKIPHSAFYCERKLLSARMNQSGTKLILDSHGDYMDI